MPFRDMKVVLVHGAWADGSSWSKVIGRLAAHGVSAVAAPLPLTSLADDVAALDRTLERIEQPVVLVGHAYAGAVIGSVRASRMRARVRSYEVDHTPIVTAPEVVAEFVLEAAQAISTR